MESVQKLLISAVPSLTRATPLDTSGEPISPRESVKCMQCHDTGWISGNRLQTCPCRRERILRAAIPRRYQSADLEDFPPETSRTVLQWFEQPTDGLLLCGSTGTGKTHMAAAIVRLQLKAGKKALFKRASEFYSAIRKSYNAPDSNEEDVMREYAQIPLLALDDLGAGSLSDHERRCTLEVLDRRLDAMLPTIVTTNWTIDQIGDRMDERIASRLGGFFIVAITGRDRRAERRTT